MRARDDRWQRKHCRVAGVFALQEETFGTLQVDFARPTGTTQHIYLTEVEVLVLISRLTDAMVKREHERAHVAEVQAKARQKRNQGETL